MLRDENPTMQWLLGKEQENRAKDFFPSLQLAKVEKKIKDIIGPTVKQFLGNQNQKLSSSSYWLYNKEITKVHGVFIFSYFFRSQDPWSSLLSFDNPWWTTWIAYLMVVGWIPLCNSFSAASSRLPATITTLVVPSPASISWALDSSTNWEARAIFNLRRIIFWTRPCKSMKFQYKSFPGTIPEIFNFRKGTLLF